MSVEIGLSNDDSAGLPSSPLLSIITVVFNSEKYIENTIISVISQTFRDFELVVIDGASTDGTLEIIRRFQDHIQYFVSEPDNGIYDAMNKGILASKGEYLLFLNSGDELNNFDTLEAIFSRYNGADVIYGETNLVDSNKHNLGTRTQLTTRKLPKSLGWLDLKKGMVVCHQSYIVKKSISPFYQVKYKCSADIDWMIMTLKRAEKISNVNQVISKYMVGGFSGKNMKRCWQERFAIMSKHYGLGSAAIFHIYIFWRFLIKPLFEVGKTR